MDRVENERLTGGGPTTPEPADTVSVTYEVLEVDRIERGSIMAAACVRLEIEGVEVLLQGVTMRRSGEGKADVQPPQFRDPRTGTWYPAVILPDSVWQAIALEMGEAVVGHPVELLG